MASKSSRGRKPRPVSSHSSDQLSVKLSSGFTLVIERPTINEIRAVQKKAESLYPMPEPPSEEIQTVTGKTYDVAAPDDDESHRKQVEQVIAQRLEYQLEYVFQECCYVEGYNSEEGRQELVERFAARRLRVEKWGEVPEDMRDLDSWQYTLRMFIVADSVDYTTVTVAANHALDTSGITEDDIRQRVAFL